ncbi:Glu/Leu/Phe/Val dehydrogenase dimerization domain-containing protein [Oceanibaculum pacificum]|uniref:Amino acid dehydrogenase n=1 Tax=Oceanibaculum pacificum TaxID=580166 RepID=A0A154W9T2_9PROT|nr:Glu/Leu/Phe/Val dehydrogenase dimerization domain-containing protein [Oceanibaculum pacificum]KZD10289.1 amino acid dehydrogenase [Oceanibaculum pacificum]
MPIFTAPDFDNHEQVVFCNDAETGLKAIIAIHDTTRGPSLGGCRMWPYASEAAAVTDALRLSRGMTYKSALAGLPLGGGKSVIIGDAKTQKSPALFRAFGRFVDSLGGRYIAAEDVGTGVADIEAMRQVTRHVAGTAGGSGDPSPVTAYGVFQGIRAAAKAKLGRDDLAGLRVAVQGLGHVGLDLARQLYEAGAALIVADIDLDRIARATTAYRAEAMPADRIHAADVDIFAPCALGAILNDATIPEIKAGIIAGAANNQLAEERHGAALMKRGILYAPDYAINAGGIINIHHESAGKYDRAAALRQVEGIYDTLLEIFARAAAEGIPTSDAADRVAETRFGKHRQAA